MGSRLYQEPTRKLNALNPYHEAITDCLNESLTLDASGCKDIPVLQLSTAAKRTWISFFNNIESGLNCPNQWASITDFASKAAENAARLAALFHLFERKSRDISAENISRAATVIRWHLTEARKLVGTVPDTPVNRNAKKIITWLQEKAILETTPRFLQRNGPVREKAARDAAIDALIERHYLRQVSQNGKIVLSVNPSVLQF